MIGWDSDSHCLPEARLQRNVGACWRWGGGREMDRPVMRGVGGLEGSKGWGGEGWGLCGGVCGSGHVGLRL